MNQAPGPSPVRTGFRSRTWIAALALGLAVASCSLQAALPVGLQVDGPAGWVESPASLEDMRALEDQIVAISPELIAVTVGVQVDPPGNAPPNQGSGVIVSADGLVLTAWHVITGPNLPATLYLADGRRVRGVTLESNPERDSGMIRITEPGPWPFADVLPEGDAPIGTWCLATGHPGGHQLGRPPVLRVGRVISYRGGFVQSDCPIFSGDSGGPLFDVEGRVIGIHSRIREHLSFNLHVPAGVFKRDWNFLVASGPLLGIEGVDGPAGGARVTHVFPGLAADRANVLAGDLILAFDGERIDDMDELSEEVRARQVGERVRLLLLRGERELAVETILSERNVR